MEKTKYNMKKKTGLLSLICSLLLLCSCEDWLNVKPSNETAASELFSTERGFQEALSGAYTLMTAAELYGREMTFGFVDAIAQQYAWGQYDNYPYYYAQNYDYAKGTSITLCDNIWNKQFNVIANVNDLLAFVDTRRNVFATDDNYSLIKGEALALRAFLHFDLMRLYVPYDADGTSDLKVMPYVEVFSKNTSESLTQQEVTDKIIRDLKAAAGLLKCDPILTGISSPDVWFKNRQYHLNYYAVEALLARVYLYTGNTAEALPYALEVIGAQEKGCFPFVTSENATSSDRSRLDRTFSTEQVFTLDIRDLQDNTAGYTWQVSDATMLTPQNLPDKIYETSRGYSDYRHSFFERESGKDNIPSKFWQLDPKKEFVHKMPLIRISEMYYIAAECAESAGYLNTVRRARNITDDLPSGLEGEDLQNEILKEYNKEFFGEGQLFYYHKRRQTQNLGLYYVQPDYQLPMPENEINFGGRPRPEKKENNFE